VPWNIIGNARAVDAVARSLARGAVPHAYLFVGPERVGKGTAALRLAQALNCQRLARTDGAQTPALFPGAEAPPSSPPSPCLTCTPCTRIGAGLHADVQIVRIEPGPEGESRTGIAVDQMREVERTVALNPYEGRTRVIIIDPADLLTPEAQNAFLKTLEEPPPHVALILVATREERLLPTVRSRCRRVEFRLLPRAEIEAALAAEGVESERARLLARLARGRPGWALAMARNPEALERRRSLLDTAHRLPQMSMAERMGLAEKLLEAFREDREAVYADLAEWAGWWRDVLLVQSRAEEGVANADMLDALRQDAARYRPGEVLRLAQALLAAVQHLRANVQPRIALDLVMLEAPAAVREGVR